MIVDLLLSSFNPVQFVYLEGLFDSYAFPDDSILWSFWNVLVYLWYYSVSRSIYLLLTGTLQFSHAYYSLHVLSFPFLIFFSSLIFINLTIHLLSMYNFIFHQIEELSPIISLNILFPFSFSSPSGTPTLCITFYNIVQWVTEALLFYIYFLNIFSICFSVFFGLQVHWHFQSAIKLICNFYFR